MDPTQTKLTLESASALVRSLGPLVPCSNQSSTRARLVQYSPQSPICPCPPTMSITAISCLWLLVPWLFAAYDLRRGRSANPPTNLPLPTHTDLHRVS